MRYTYKYCVFTNNACAGVRFVSAHERLIDALNKKYAMQNGRGGCCDVVKKRFKPGADRPTDNSIYNNYRYSEYDL